MGRPARGLLAAGDVVQADRLIDVADRHLLAIGAERDGGPDRPVRVDGQRLARGDVPDLDRLVRAARSDGLAVPGDVEGRDGGRVSFKGADRLAAVGIPELDELVAGAG